MVRTQCIKLEMWFNIGGEVSMDLFRPIFFILTNYTSTN